MNGMKTTRFYIQKAKDYIIQITLIDVRVINMHVILHVYKKYKIVYY
jgi:hypothetical protein